LLAWRLGSCANEAKYRYFSIKKRTGKAMLDIEKEYQRRMDALTPAERVARSIGMACWARRLIAGKILAERGPMSDERLKWETALRVYGADPKARATIERKLRDVPL